MYLFLNRKAKLNLGDFGGKIRLRQSFVDLSRKSHEQRSKLHMPTDDIYKPAVVANLGHSKNCMRTGPF